MPDRRGGVHIFDRERTSEAGQEVRGLIIARQRDSFRYAE